MQYSKFERIIQLFHQKDQFEMNVKRIALFASGQGTNAQNIVSILQIMSVL